jgi:hypothetical protein
VHAVREHCLTDLTPEAYAQAAGTDAGTPIVTGP